MGRLPARRWTLGAAAGLAALLLTGCLSTNPQGLHAPKDTPPTPATSLVTPPYTPPTTTPTYTPPAHAAAPKPAPAAPQAGQKLSYFVYRLRRGDTLYSLARRFHVTVKELQEDNHITTPTDLPVGKPLVIRRVPGAEPPPGPTSESAPAPVVGPRRAVAEALLNRGKPSAQFWWPTGGTLIRRFGQEVRGFSDPGIAIRAAAGTEVYAVAGGKVVSVVLGGDNAQSVWGNVVSIEHADKMTSWYAHLARVLVKEGEQVRKGEAIGTVGRTGQGPEPMLAFRLYRDNRPVNPLPYLP